MKNRKTRIVVDILAIILIVVGVIYSDIYPIIIIGVILLVVSMSIGTWHYFKMKSPPEVTEKPTEEVILQEEEYVYTFDKEVLGNNGILNFETDIVKISFLSKSKCYLYTCSVRDIFDWSFPTDKGNVIIEIELTQSVLLGNIRKTLQWKHFPQQISFKTNFQDITWSTDLQGKRMCLKVYEKKKPTKKK